MSKRTKRWILAGVIVIILAAAGIIVSAALRDAETLKDLNKVPQTVLVGYLEQEDRYVKLAEVNRLPGFSTLKHKRDARGNRIKTPDNQAILEEDPGGDDNPNTNFYSYYNKEERPEEQVRIYSVYGTPREAAEKAGFTDPEETTVDGKTGYLGVREDGGDLITGFFTESPYQEISIGVTVTILEKENNETGILDELDAAAIGYSVAGTPEDAAGLFGYTDPEEVRISGTAGYVGSMREEGKLKLGVFTDSPAGGISFATIVTLAEQETPETDESEAEKIEIAREERAMSILDLTVAQISPEKQEAAIAKDFRQNFIQDSRWKFLTNGLLVTMEITLFAVLLGIAIGVLVAVVRSAWDQNAENMRAGLGKGLLSILNGICKTYLTVIRGTPVVVQLMIIYYVIFAGAQNGTLIGSLAFGINSGAYVAEIIRGGIMSVDRGQLEAGRSLGFNYVQTMRHIIVPQAFKTVLPALANEFIVLLKETSVAGYVAVMDLTKGGETIRGLTYSPFMPLLAVALIYLVVVMFFTWLVGKLERRLRSSDH